VIASELAPLWFAGLRHRKRLTQAASVDQAVFHAGGEVGGTDVMTAYHTDRHPIGVQVVARFLRVRHPTGHIDARWCFA
jgi:hypothetical protein